MPTAASGPGRAPRCRRALFITQLAALAACADSRSATDVTDPSAGPMRSGMNADVISTATNGKIAFVSFRDGNYEIYIMEPDGSGQTRLTNYELEDDEPAWSPDGTKIAFQRQVAMPDGGFQSDIYVMNADGSGQTGLSNDTAFDNMPAWSPDGTKIAFAKVVADNTDIYVMNADGSAPIRLTTDPGFDGEPAWSPDGTKIAYTRLETLNDFSEIFVMNPDGSGQTNLTNNPAADYEPAWSPDGTRLAFFSSRSSSYEIWTMNPDGSGLIQVTNLPGTGNTSPAWQPIPITPPYAFAGFFPPVDNLPTANVAKAGSGIPLKFSLDGDQGLDIFRAGFPKFVAEPCDPSDRQDPLEATTDSPSGLSYDQASGQYIYVWKTSRALADRCGRLELGLKDGSDHAALFRFTR